MPSVSIIIPTLNADVSFCKLLDALGSQILKAEEILIIASNYNDGTAELAKSHGCKITQINKHDFDHGTTRNLGVTQTNSEFVVFLTQDAIPADDHTIAELIKPMQAKPNIAICYGRQLPRLSASPLERFFREFNYPPQSILKTKKDIDTLGLKTFFCSNCCSAIRRSIFNKLSGFKNNVIVNEDMLFAAKAINAGYMVYYAAEAKVYHSHTYSLRETFKRYFKIGRFFADNRWLLQRATLKDYGGGVLKAGVKTFWQKRAPHYIPVFLAELALKTIAYKLGWYYQLLFHKKRI